MKNFLFALIIGLLSSINACAQIEITKPIEELVPNKKSIVTNENGVKYTYASWSKLLSTGNYKLKPVQFDSDSTAFILSKRNEEAENKMFASKGRPDETKFFKNGDKFKFFDLKDMNGILVKANDLKNKIIVINFWFIACPPCRYEMPELNRLVTAYQNNKDVIFIGITLDRKQDVTRFLKVSPFRYHVISDSMSLFNFYKVDECPASLIVDKKGTIIFNSQGSGNGSVPYWIKQTIDEELKK